MSQEASALLMVCRDEHRTLSHQIYMRCGASLAVAIPLHGWPSDGIWPLDLQQLPTATRRATSS